MLNCDYCGKSQDDVPYILEGKQGAGICSNCVLLCMEIITEKFTEMSNKKEDKQSKESTSNE